MALAFRYLAADRNGDMEIAGTGVRVYDVFEQSKFYAQPADMVGSWPGVSLAAIYEAMAYALEHPEEMDTIRRADKEVEGRVLREAQERTAPRGC